MWLQLDSIRDFNFVWEEVTSLLHILIADMGYNCDQAFQSRNKQALLLIPWAEQEASQGLGLCRIVGPILQLAGPCVPVGYWRPSPQHRHEDPYLWPRPIGIHLCVFTYTTMHFHSFLEMMVSSLVFQSPFIIWI